MISASEHRMKIIREAIAAREDEAARLSEAGRAGRQRRAALRITKRPVKSATRPVPAASSSAAASDEGVEVRVSKKQAATSFEYVPPGARWWQTPS